MYNYLTIEYMHINSVVYFFYMHVTLVFLYNLLYCNMFLCCASYSSILSHTLHYHENDHAINEVLSDIFAPI